MSQSITDEIIIAEEKLRLAMLSSNLKELEELLSDDLIFTNHLGAIISKQDDIGMHASGDLEIEKIQISDRRVLLLDNIAVTTSKAEIIGSYQNLQSNSSFRFTRVWKKTPRIGWQVIVGHSSVLA